MKRISNQKSNYDKDDKDDENDDDDDDDELDEDGKIISHIILYDHCHLLSHYYLSCIIISLYHLSIQPNNHH